jgi:hypothetical protein
MNIDKYVKILQLLAEQTNSGKLNWKETGDQSKFLVSFPNYSIIVSEEMGEGDEQDYFISIVNSEGRVVDRFSAAMFPNWIWGSNAYGVIRDLYNQARRKALRADRALDDIIAHLGSDAGR